MSSDVLTLSSPNSWCLFRPCPAGSREGPIVLVQFASLGTGENGGRFTVKKYHSEKTFTADGWRHDRIQFLPLNPACVCAHHFLHKWQLIRRDSAGYGKC
jgi:hypothetical protein